MPDPRLNSFHLEFPRRYTSRHARDALLEARGPLTLDAELSAEWSAEQYDSDFPPYVLLGVQPDGLSGAVYTLKVGLNTIGKFDSNDIVLDEISVSRRHCCILVHASGE